MPSPISLVPRRHSAAPRIARWAKWLTAPAVLAAGVLFLLRRRNREQPGATAEDVAAAPAISSFPTPPLDSVSTSPCDVFPSQQKETPLKLLEAELAPSEGIESASIAPPVIADPAFANDPAISALSEMDEPSSDALRKHGLAMPRVFQRRTIAAAAIFFGSATIVFIAAGAMRSHQKPVAPVPTRDENLRAVAQVPAALPHLSVPPTDLPPPPRASDIAPPAEGPHQAAANMPPRPGATASATPRTRHHRSSRHPRTLRAFLRKLF